MQKIFVKGYINRALASVVIGLIVLVCFFYQIIVKGGWDGDANLFMPIMGFGYAFVFFYWANGTPNYLYVAPISFKERVAIFRKVFLIRNIMLIVPLTVIGLLPVFVYGIVNNIGIGIIWIVLVLILLSNSMFIKDYFPLLMGSKPLKSLEVSYVLTSFVFPLIGSIGLENFPLSEIGNNKADMILAGFVFLYSISGVLYCTLKYRRKLFNMYADYESYCSARSILDKRKEGRMS